MNEHSLDKDQKTPEIFKSLAKFRGEEESEGRSKFVANQNDYISFKGEFNALSQKGGFLQER